MITRLAARVQIVQDVQFVQNVFNLGTCEKRIERLELFERS
jgi:hypothetical protein